MSDEGNYGPNIDPKDDPYVKRVIALRRGVPKALVQGDGDAGSTVEWATPDALFDALDAEFGPFTLDPATALGFHTSNVILSRGGRVVTLDGVWEMRDRDYPDETDIIAAELVEDDDGAPLPGDGLHAANPWTGRVWLNHPYGREDWRWMKKAHDSVRFGSAEIVVALVPVKTQMKWWHKYVGATELTREGDFAFVAATAAGADVIRFVRKRLTFGGAPSSAPFNSAVIVWRK